MIEEPHHLEVAEPGELAPILESHADLAELPVVIDVAVVDHDVVERTTVSIVPADRLAVEDRPLSAGEVKGHLSRVRREIEGVGGSQGCRAHVLRGQPVFQRLFLDQVRRGLVPGVRRGSRPARAVSEPQRPDRGEGLLSPEGAADQGVRPRAPPHPDDTVVQTELELRSEPPDGLRPKPRGQLLQVRLALHRIEVDLTAGVDMAVELQLGNESQAVDLEVGVLFLGLSHNGVAVVLRIDEKEVDPAAERELDAPQREHAVGKERRRIGLFPRFLLFHPVELPLELPDPLFEPGEPLLS